MEQHDWCGFGSVLFVARLLQKLLQVSPPDQDDVILIKELLEFWTRDGIVIPLPPGGAIVVVINHHSL
jgi:hypothetical protein